MSRTPTVTPEEQAAIANWVNTNKDQHGKGAIKRAAEFFGKTPAVIRGCFPKVEEPKKAKSEKPVKAKKARNAKAKGFDSSQSILSDGIKLLESKAAAYDKIKKLVNQ